MEMKPYKLSASPAGVKDNWISEQNRTDEVQLTLMCRAENGEYFTAGKPEIFIRNLNINLFFLVK
jgi:hypothetical protein